MNRIDRVTAILIQLQSRKVIRAQDIAERFGISLRTVYRDIRTLEEAGVPLSGEAGVGYSIMEGYRLPPVMFTIEEATAFLTAEKMVEKLTDTSMEANYKSAMYKVRSVLRSAEKDQLEVMDDHIEVLANSYIPDTRDTNGSISAILKSITGRRALEITYFADHSQQETIREVEPVGVFYYGSRWYMIAFCRLREDYRNFRTDRIRKITFTAKPFGKEHPPLKQYLAGIKKEKELQEVVIRIRPEVSRYFGDQKYYNGFVSEQETGGWIEMTFLTSSMEGFARWFMMFGDMAELISPPEIGERVAGIAGKILGTVVPAK